jgi:hypothetical protein
VFLLNYPDDGDFTLNLTEYGGGGDNFLSIAIDGKQVSETKFFRGRRELREKESFVCVGPGLADSWRGLFYAARPKPSDPRRVRRALRMKTRKPSAFCGVQWVCTKSTTPTHGGFRVNTKMRNQIERRKQRIMRRLDKKTTGGVTGRS